MRSVKIGGTASKEVVADLSIVTISIKIADKELKEVYAEYNRVMEELKRTVCNIGEITGGSIAVLTSTDTIKRIFGTSVQESNYATAFVNIRFKKDKLDLASIANTMDHYKRLYSGHTAKELEYKRFDYAVKYRDDFSSGLIEKTRRDLLESAYECAADRLGHLLSKMSESINEKVGSINTRYIPADVQCISESAAIKGAYNRCVTDSVDLEYGCQSESLNIEHIETVDTRKIITVNINVIFVAEEDINDYKG